MQMRVYETFEDIYGRKSTLDELIADVSQFTQKSVLLVCATIVAGMQLWNRVDAQPAMFSRHSCSCTLTLLSVAACWLATGAAIQDMFSSIAGRSC
jgi:hypothetical protein